MNIIFISNVFNHHQKFLSDALYEKTKKNYYFVETEMNNKEHNKFGEAESRMEDYVLNYINRSYEKLYPTMDDSEIMIAGSAPKELIQYRLASKKILFRYSERPLKANMTWIKYLYRCIHWRYLYRMRFPQYMLCASAYTSGDFAKFGLFKKRTYKWGYFPETKKYEDINQLIKLKEKSTILWVGRFLELKHPDALIRIARRLKIEGVEFQINFIGTGEMEKQLREDINKYDLKDCVHILGAMKPQQVREYMEKSQIFLFTSDRNEGWGVVLNESMNSACAVVASHAIGSVPFLLKDKENGLIYKDGDEEELYQKVKILLDNPQLCEAYGKKAYETIVETWNAEVAAERFINLAEHILAGEKSPDLYESGPCSKAEIIKDDWYK